MDIRNVQGIDEGWDDYVWNSPGGTIFHTTRFLSYHPATRFEFMNLAVSEGDDLVCVLPGGRVSTGDGSVFRSPVAKNSVLVAVKTREWYRRASTAPSFATASGVPDSGDA